MKGIGVTGSHRVDHVMPCEMSSQLIRHPANREAALGGVRHAQYLRQGWIYVTYIDIIILLCTNRDDEMKNNSSQSMEIRLQSVHNS